MYRARRSPGAPERCDRERHEGHAHGRPNAKGTAVVVRVEVRASGFPPGIERVIGIFRSTIRKGLIVRQTNDYDKSDPQTGAILTAIEQRTGTPTS